MEYYSKIIAKINQFLNRNSETYKGLLRAATMGRKGSALRSSESFSLCANSKETARQRRKDYSGSQLWSITVGRGGQSAAKKEHRGSQEGKRGRDRRGGERDRALVGFLLLLSFPPVSLALHPAGRKEDTRKPPNQGAPWVGERSLRVKL